MKDCRLSQSLRMVLEAVHRSGFALEFAAEHLREDRSFVLQAVQAR